jgi:hypothetical protein
MEGNELHGEHGSSRILKRLLFPYVILTGLYFMGDGRNHCGFLGTKRIDLDHKAAVNRLDEILVDSFLENRWGERTELLAERDLRIDDLAYIWAPAVARG